MHGESDQGTFEQGDFGPGELVNPTADGAPTDTSAADRRGGYRRSGEVVDRRLGLDRRGTVGAEPTNLERRRGVVIQQDTREIAHRLVVQRTAPVLGIRDPLFDPRRVRRSLGLRHRVQFVELRPVPDRMPGGRFSAASFCSRSISTR